MMMCRHRFIMIKFMVCLLSLICPILSVNRTVDQDNAALEVFNNCECVRYYLCDKDNYIITNGETIIEQRGPDTAERILCQGGAYAGEIICCKQRNSATFVTKSPVATKPTPTQPPNDNEVVTKPPKKKKLKCGQQLPIINIRVLSDENPVPIDGEFPWTAAIFLNKNNGGVYKFQCSGSLIRPNVVLTSNHCVQGTRAEDVKVIVNGKAELNEVGKDPSSERGVQEILSHPDYYSGALFNDVALLILGTSYNISARTDNINTICLLKGESFEGKRCFVAGWGKTNTGAERKVLKKVILPTIEFSQCQEMLRQTRLGTRFILHDSFMCAGGEKDKDACIGDGGSPLMCPSKNGKSYFQAGIVAWGIGCGEQNVPGVYANVPKFIDWINEELQKRNINLDT